MKISIMCPSCYDTKVIDYMDGVFDLVFYDEPRFPGSSIFRCDCCDKVVNLGGEGILVKVINDNRVVPVKIKTDDFNMVFKIKSFKGDLKEYNINRLEEVVGRFFTDGSLPD